MTKALSKKRPPGGAGGGVEAIPGPAHEDSALDRHGLWTTISDRTNGKLPETRSNGSPRIGSGDGRIDSPGAKTVRDADLRVFPKWTRHREIHMMGHETDFDHISPYPADGDGHRSGFAAVVDIPDLFFRHPAACRR